MTSSVDPIVRLRAIRKSFGATEVLHGVDFEVRPGEVHVLAGENGAGKSTLVNILSGVYDDFSGELLFRGRARRFTRPADAARAGIATIHQELSLVPSMTVADNLFLGRERTDRWGRVDFAGQEREAAALLAEAGLDASPRQLVAELAVSTQQMLEIARALAREAALVILDEPTSALNEREVEVLFARIAALRGQGRGIVYITHKMEEIYRLADRITVLRDGARVGTAAAAELPPGTLVSLMVGRDLEEPEVRSTAVGDQAVLEVVDLRVARPAAADRPLVDGVSFTLRRGEILGLAGLRGSGANDVLHALFGATGARSGSVTLEGRAFAPSGPAEALARGVILLTNDRKAKGLASEQSVTHSVSLASLGRFSGPGAWIRRRAERRAVAEVTGSFRLDAPSLDAPVRTLSGGNQQKVYLARCLMTEPRVLLLDEPTRGIDIGAKTDIYGLMKEWVGRGISILLITSEMDELVRLCHRILVLHRGRVVTELERDTATKDRILSAAMGHAAAGAPATGNRGSGEPHV
ncbi:MAG: sugar ABC transporter ATP-binding protein [Gemmatimonadota bacterium]